MLYNQIRVWFVFCVTGIIIGFIFDLFRAQRRAIKTNDFITDVQDILFWIISGFVIISSAVTYTNGEIRSYMALGLITGVVFYFVLISKYVIRFFVCILNTIIKFFKSLFGFFCK